MEDIFNFCWMTLLDEAKKSNVFFDKNTCNVRNDIDENFTAPLDRISYLYKFGSYNISLFHQCLKDFCENVPDSMKIIDKFRSLNSPTICSMSVGPGTDIIGFLYSLYLINKPLVNATNFKVISKYGSWRNLVTAMINSSIINVPDGSNCKLIECDFLKNLSKKAQSYLREADILLMCNCFSSFITPEKLICDTLKRIIELLKPNALVFFIFSKEKSTYFKDLHSFGGFLYGPVEITLENISYNENIVELVGIKPLSSGTSLFGVWQKSHEIKPEISFQKETENNLSVGSNQHFLTKLINSKTDAEKLSFTTCSLSNSERELSIDSNIRLNDKVKINSSTGISSSSNFSQSIYGKKNSVATDDSVNFNDQNFNFSETNCFNNSTSNTFSEKQGVSDLSVKKKFVLSSGNDYKNLENHEKDINSLLKKLEKLITKFEGLIGSRDTLNHFHAVEKQSLCGQYCHQSMYLDHCRCVKPCQSKKNGYVSCCSSMCNNYFNVDDYNSSSSVAHKLYKTVALEGAYITIPLQNLSDESLANILSTVSKYASVNKTTTNLFPKKEDS